MDDIGDREWLVLKFVIEYRERYQMSPSLRGIMDHLNQTLPDRPATGSDARRKKGAKRLRAITGVFQINRSMDKLVAAGLIRIVEPDGVVKTSRNAIPTDEGIKYYRRRR